MRSGPNEKEGVSVVVCCYNSASRLPKTLEHLRAQRAHDVPWEVVIVDNGATDETAALAIQEWQGVSLAPLRVVQEPQKGLAHARSRGCHEARYELVSFIDDDNWVAPDWVAEVSRLFQEWPEAGVIGSASSVAVDTEVPHWFAFCSQIFAISAGDWGSADVSDTRGSVWGAGMTIRRSAWRALQLAAAPHLLAGRTGKSQAGGEDNELCIQMRLAGYRIRYEPSLRLRHYMPPQRLRWSYALDLFHGSGEASVALDAYARHLDRLTGSQRPGHKYSTLWRVLVSLRFLVTHRVASSDSSNSAAPHPLLPQISYHRGRLAGLIRNLSASAKHCEAVNEFCNRLSEVRPVPITSMERHSASLTS